MSIRSISRRWVRVFVLVVSFQLLDQLAYAHEAHENKAIAPSTVVAPAAAESVAHEHPGATGSVDTEKAPNAPTTLLSWLGRFHPMVIHFPIAFFITPLVAEILFAATRRDLFRHALRFLLWGGAASAIFAVALGWTFAATGPTDHGWLLEAHRWAGTAVSALGLAVLAVNERFERTGGSRALLRFPLVAIAVLVGATGFLGGSLLYGIDHLAWSQR
ncbi:MAG: hypothetical protein JRE71_13930 [Deltaproteobacteria bacterium]|nr:hypothetical protein [Deltaproteobacteria bacterium]MBW2725480.1 hypothetical protein [Deltaproteobacteria bacterium]